MGAISTITALAQAHKWMSSNYSGDELNREIFLYVNQRKPEQLKDMRTILMGNVRIASDEGGAFDRANLIYMLFAQQRYRQLGY